MLLLSHRVPMLATERGREREIIINIVFQIDSSQRGSEGDCRGSGHMQIDPRVKSNVCEFESVLCTLSLAAFHQSCDVHRWTGKKQKTVPVRELYSLVQSSPVES